METQAPLKWLLGGLDFCLQNRWMKTSCQLLFDFIFRRQAASRRLSLERLLKLSKPKHEQ
jgi:hypothetical protein